MAARRGLDADDDLDVLGYWLTSQAPPMMQTCHHLHGGMGMDVTYPMHRYYSSIKDLTRLLGRPRPSSGSGWSAMYIELTPDQRQLQAEMRQYFANLISPTRPSRWRSTATVKAYRAVIKRMGSTANSASAGRRIRRLGFGPIEQQIFVNEAARADVPLPAVTLQTVGPTLMVYGNDARREVPPGDPGRRRALRHRLFPNPRAAPTSRRYGPPRSATATIHRQRAEDLWTTGGHDADYVWLACRTDPEAAKGHFDSYRRHRRSRGWTPIILSDGAPPTPPTTTTSGPRRHARRAENASWRLITATQSRRVMLSPASKDRGHLRDL